MSPSVALHARDKALRYLLLDNDLRCWRQGTHGLELSEFEREFRRATAEATELASLPTERWAGDISAERVGHVWRPEDREFASRAFAWRTRWHSC